MTAFLNRLDGRFIMQPFICPHVNQDKAMRKKPMILLARGWTPQE
jgi:hypothetical protein